MSYALLVIKSDAEWEAMSDAEKEFDALVRWWADLRERGVIVSGAQLAPPGTATTVRWKEGRPLVSDGPHLEAKETVGGIVVLAVDTQEEAEEVAATWPSQRAIRLEVRRVVSDERYMDAASSGGTAKAC